MCIGYNLNSYINMDSQSQHLIDHNYIQNFKEEINVSNHIVDHDYALPVIMSVSDNDDKDVPDDVIVEKPKNYRILPGIQRNTKIYVDNLGYKYYKKKLLVNTITLICERQRSPSRPICYGTASISIDISDNHISIRNPHNHEPPVIDLNVPLLRNALTERGLDPTITTMSVRSIYNNEIIWHQEAAKNYTYTQTKARVKRMRRLRKLKC
ncbi:uncharacterized protein LOC132928683 isoform X1 [Rhopalosiphum padi]|uniref:uncharacterized protein LOC132928683 isoform X1 n=3 Tax=Rhopalosiphum padi TaxID=40932 RepID=UPI00298DE428|nr:uncharacterized protein LOC132928683 isoform X1 [Rhopalosiphum padi]XP_060849498.1 uncharacterized protein LOC132928683 isoform X1 [Rhopalosiphum padi]XP_060849499.1 uncharacterized protein LOC132928683 isoform X1 [Rhopalosiphum padi]XP_060849500.1 uncharacterized protein LOC132928683 isoform X1 [Rhopalosiphum padi]